MLAVLDNYDSFTYNLVQAFGDLGEPLQVYRNDECRASDFLASNPDGVIISPGPCTPNEAGISLDVIRQLKAQAERGTMIPILGVCLGHQALAQIFGSAITQAPEIVHGKQSLIFHNGGGLFSGLEQGFPAGRYHSLIVDSQHLSADCKITAWTKTGLIMGIQHKAYPFYGVQFHPESILTPEGAKILQAFLHIVRTTPK
ncbi:anthranilate synthase component II [Desulfitobacterium metallireducens]|uniref:Anthranilate synthase n=1 Tax=Desulfitobacterium metallireducens DSM 15288 TaxID=871968 RepID=W0EFV4_9FIRM|nr:aminodeoxychorismate/anthranilate synthase component II [Desulfitobacterium metallireducens]AHF07956.1 anthranilate synthase [Desulfitobacterium metallireducens DSM 15288]